MLLLGFSAATAAAQDGAVQGFGLDAAQRIVRESNLYRLADGQDPGLGERADWVSLTRLGARFRTDIGLQEVALAAGVNAIRYRDNDHLDHEGVDADARWGWQLGRALKGHLSFLQAQTLSSFAEYDGQDRSVNTFRRLEFVGDHALTPRWSWGLGANYTSSDYSGDTRPTADYRVRGLSLRGGYKGRAGEQLVLSVGRAKGEYPQRTATRFADQEYTQNDYRLSGSWAASGATDLNGYIGYLTRRYDFADNRDYDGVVGRFELAWRPTGKLRLDSQVRREIGAQEDLVDNYVVTDAIRLRPAWAYTDKVELAGEMEFMRRDFGGDPGFFEETPADRTERLRRLGVSANYRYSRALDFGASMRWEARSADTDAREYDARTASVSASLRF
ncbi:MAG: outer membrane beta-barrel protein [Rhodocyclaceae bacterium]|nr:outer membrane beta-barrel protein [Rhodocyclaceae bacterium]